MKTDIGLGPQGEQIEERTVGKPVLSPMAGMVIRLFSRDKTESPVDDRIKSVISLSPEDYAALIWSNQGHAVKQALLEAGLHDADVPGGRLCPDYPKGAHHGDL